MSQNGCAFLEESTDPNYEPSLEEIENYAQWLGMDLETDRLFLWIAREGLKAPLPTNWKLCRPKDSTDHYYFNVKTEERTWDHPGDSFYRKMFEQQKRTRVEKEKEENDAVRVEILNDVAALRKIRSDSKKVKYFQKNDSSRKKQISFGGNALAKDKNLYEVSKLKKVSPMIKQPPQQTKVEDRKASINAIPASMNEISTKLSLFDGKQNDITYNHCDLEAAAIGGKIFDEQNETIQTLSTSASVSFEDSSVCHEKRCVEKRCTATVSQITADMAKQFESLVDKIDIIVSNHSDKIVSESRKNFLMVRQETEADKLQHSKEREHAADKYQQALISNAETVAAKYCEAVFRQLNELFGRNMMELSSKIESYRNDVRISVDGGKLSEAVTGGLRPYLNEQRECNDRIFESFEALASKVDNQTRNETNNVQALQHAISRLDSFSNSFEKMEVNCEHIPFGTVHAISKSVLQEKTEELIEEIGSLLSRAQQMFPNDEADPRCNRVNELLVGLEARAEASVSNERQFAKVQDTVESLAGTVERVLERLSDACYSERVAESHPLLSSSAACQTETVVRVDRAVPDVDLGEEVTFYAEECTPSDVEMFKLTGGTAEGNGCTNGSAFHDRIIEHVADRKQHQYDGGETPAVSALGTAPIGLVNDGDTEMVCYGQDATDGTHCGLAHVQKAFRSSDTVSSARERGEDGTYATYFSANKSVQRAPKSTDRRRTAQCHSTAGTDSSAASSIVDLKDYVQFSPRTDAKATGSHAGSAASFESYALPRVHTTRSGEAVESVDSVAHAYFNMDRIYREGICDAAVPSDTGAERKSSSRTIQRPSSAFCGDHRRSRDRRQFGSVEAATDGSLRSRIPAEYNCGTETIARGSRRGDTCKTCRRASPREGNTCTSIIESHILGLQNLCDEMRNIRFRA